MSRYKNLPPGERAPEIVNMVIETPKGSGHKYEYNSDLDVVCLDRTLYSPMHYPGDYGFIPGNLAEDGDTLDGLILLEQPTFPGCMSSAANRCLNNDRSRPTGRKNPRCVVRRPADGGS